jgi:hypothetical protein
MFYNVTLQIDSINQTRFGVPFWRLIRAFPSLNVKLQLFCVNWKKWHESCLAQNHIVQKKAVLRLTSGSGNP